MRHSDKNIAKMYAHTNGDGKREYTQQEVAEFWGLTNQQVSNILQIIGKTESLGETVKELKPSAILEIAKAPEEDQMNRRNKPAGYR